MPKLNVLFVCLHNSARSQMAEAFLNSLGGDSFYAESAGLEAGTINPYVVQVMKEVGIDISQNKTDSVFEFFKQGRLYAYVIAVCDAANAERCPIFPGVCNRLNWSFPNPAEFKGTDQEILAETRKVRDMIKTEIEKFIVSYKQ
ncbi:MAG: low molecular weight phosphatase family protein [Bacteroidales bacterium 45-6]|uniref:arsenate reductase ArsC n=1 Tax=uncultured Dysgonomonas sp. TaxID=206096 RepID=UPI00095A0E85|nr:arsenate reductase ArsC [uncultured Dysgonomonas sp.]OJU55597.1 MAG: low molecular weight phosphatase family protein [Bacteroidales bacterium 45-6]